MSTQAFHGLGSLSELFGSTQRILFSTQDSISKANNILNKQYKDKKDEKWNNNSIIDLETSIEYNIVVLSRNLNSLSSLLELEGGNKRDLWLHRIQSLKEQFNENKKLFHHWKQEMKQFQIREELFHNENNNNINNNSTNKRIHTNAIDSQIRTQESLIRSNNMINELQSMTNNALESVRSQGNFLKSARKRALDVMNTLGLSNSLIKMIERREGINAIITYACMIFTFLVIIFTYYYFRRK
jgi:Golgi SNAP receptor complex protein 2